MSVAGEEIQNPKQGILYCNDRIKQCEHDADECRKQGDYKTAAKFEGWIVAWMEQLQHFIRMDIQTGGQQEDASKAVSNVLKRKSRFNG